MAITHARFSLAVLSGSGVLPKRQLRTCIALKKASSIMSKLKDLAFGEEKDTVTHKISESDSFTDQRKGLLEHSVPKIQLPFSNVQERLESAVREEIGERFRGSSDSWMEIDIDDLVVKFKVLRKCYEEFGVLIPNNKLSSIKTVKDLLNYYSSLQPEEKRSFASIDTRFLPSNLTIN